MSSDPYAHIEEAFGLDENPFPAEAVSAGGVNEYYSDHVFPDETREFRMKMIRGGLQGGRKMGFLWSMSKFGDDTGFGKTALMRNTVTAINTGELGAELQISLGVKPEKVKAIVAVYADLNEQSRNGLYPVLFTAAQNLTSGPSAVMGIARERLLEAADGDVNAIWGLVTEKQIELAPGGQALRPDVMEAFLESPEDLGSMLSDVSDASRLRSGVQYFTALLYILSAAGIEKVFLMIDQLEDLGKKGALSAAKRRREIGRIRDLLETEPFASRLHTSFTFHQAAAQNLEADWEANRLPSFDTASSNAAGVVVLRGIQDDSQVEELLKVWMEPHRNEHAGPSMISPFASDAMSVLRSASQGRAGILLNRANELVMAGAEAQVGEIDAAFASTHFQGKGILSTVAAGVDDDPADDYDDLLA